MLILGIFIAIMVDALAIIAARRIIGATVSRTIAILAVVGAAGVIVVSLVVASLATTTVQTMVVMNAMSRKEPYASILKDRQIRPQIRKAVEQGLSMSTGTMRENVATSVRAVIEPYMTYRLKSANDVQVVALARITLATLEKARTRDGNECALVASGDKDALRRQIDVSAMDDWLKTTLREEPTDEPAISNSVTVTAFRAQAVASKGIGPQDLARAAADARDPIACDIAVTTLRTALTLPTPKAAAVLRGLDIGRNAVTR